MRARQVDPPPVRRTVAPTNQQVDQDLELISRLMDSAFEIPGLRWRFGLDAVIGLVPGIGDVVSGGISFAIIGLAAVRYRLPPITIARMGINLAIDVVIGAIPFLGDLFDVWWKVNQRNMDLIRRRAAGPGLQARRGSIWDWAFVAGIAAFLLLFLGAVGILIWTALLGLLNMVIG